MPPVLLSRLTGEEKAGKLKTYRYNKYGERTDIRGTDGILFSEQGSQKKFYMPNILGDVAHIKNSGQTKPATNYAYDAFGRLLTERSDTDANPFLYRGEYADTETGFTYLRNRYYSSATANFLTEDPAKDGTNWYIYCGNNPVLFVDPWGLEFLIVSGSEYDDGRYKYNFIEPAIKKIAELKTLNPNESLTWLISKTGYSDSALADFQEVADYYSVNLELIENADQLVNYINSKDINNSYYTYARAYDKIRKFAIFSHGYENVVALGYNQGDIGWSLELTKSNIQKIDSSAFYDTNSAFYSCFTGAGGNNSFAQAWVNIAGGRTWAATGRTDYADINKGQDFMRWIEWRITVGFRPTGSMHYPKEGANGSYFTNFYRR